MFDIDCGLYEIVSICSVDLSDKGDLSWNIDDMLDELARIARISLCRHKFAKRIELVIMISMFGKNLRNYSSVCTVSDTIHGSETNFHIIRR
jgi:hypothetical protein